MNLSGIKVSSAQIEAAILQAEGISETAAVAVTPKAGGPSLLVFYLVPDRGAEVAPRQTRLAMQDLIKTHLNPMFRIHDVVIKKQLHRTASNKVMRRVLRAEYEKDLSRS